MVFRAASLADKHLILSIFQRSPSFFERVEGCLPNLGMVEDAIEGRPAKTCSDYKKEFYVLEFNGEPIGTCELHVHHPEAGTAYIGLLLLREDLFGRGLGRRAYKEVERFLSEERDCPHIRLGVADDNDVSGFWSKMGFSTNGKNYTWTGARKANNVVEYEKWARAPQVELSSDNSQSASHPSL